MRHPRISIYPLRAFAFAACFLVPAASMNSARANEPNPKMYWDVKDVKAGMKGIGHTVLVGTKVEEFEAEVLGVMRDVNPGRDMILCRLKGCKLEHSGIVQGMSGSPIYIDGKLLGAVAFGWEFAKDPIAGITPFSQMVGFVRASDRRFAAEAQGAREKPPTPAGAIDGARTLMIDGLLGDDPEKRRYPLFGDLGVDRLKTLVESPLGMRRIATPIAATGFSPRALALLGDRFAPIGLAPTAGGKANEEIIAKEGDKPFAPGSPLCVGLVLGDFDISGVGTVTHVEGDRVYGFGHPMFGLGSCELPLMTGYVHTVYPRASVSMKLSSPLKIVGVLDTDVSTGVAGRVGVSPDMLPMSATVKTGRYAEPRTFNVRIAREPSLMPTLVLTVLANAIDTEGNLPDELTAHLAVTIKIKGREPLVMRDTFSGARYSGAMGPTALFGPVASIVSLLLRNPMAPVRIESIDASVEIESGRTAAELESARLASDRLEPGETLRVIGTLKPFKGDRVEVEAALTLPLDMPEGTYEATLCDSGTSLRRLIRNRPYLLEPRDLDGVFRLVRAQLDTKRTRLSLHVPLPEAGVSVRGQALPNLPASARAVFADAHEGGELAVRSDLVRDVETRWVVDGSRTLRFQVVKKADVVRDE